MTSKRCGSSLNRLSNAPHESVARRFSEQKPRGQRPSPPLLNMASRSQMGKYCTFSDIRLAVNVNETVTVASRPSGTLATMIPVTKVTVAIGSFVRTPERMLKMRPRAIARPEIYNAHDRSTLLSIRLRQQRRPRFSRARSIPRLSN